MEHFADFGFKNHVVMEYKQNLYELVENILSNWFQTIIKTSVEAENGLLLPEVGVINISSNKLIIPNGVLYSGAEI